MTTSSTAAPAATSAESPIIDDERPVTVQGQSYGIREARELSDMLRMAADRVELADAGALEVLRVSADIAGLSLPDLAREARVDKLDPETWTIYDVRRVAVELGSRIRR